MRTRVSTHRCHQLRRRQRAGEAGGEADPTTEIEVADLHRAEPIAVHT